MSPGHTAGEGQSLDPNSKFLGTEQKGDIQVENRVLEALKCYLYSHLLLRSLGEHKNIPLSTQVLNCHLKKKKGSYDFQVYLGTY